MKRLLALSICLTILCPALSYAGNLTRRERLVWEGTVVFLSVLDYRQTRRIAGDAGRWEINPLFSRQPGKWECQWKGAAIVLTKLWIGRTIKDEHTARWYYGALTGVSFYSVGRNIHMGIQVRF